MFTLGAAPNRYCDSLSCEFVFAALQLDRAVVFTLPDGKEDGDGFVFVVLRIAKKARIIRPSAPLPLACQSAYSFRRDASR